MYKFFISQKQIDGETATITGEDVNHIVNVLRLKQPDKIILCNKDEGKSYISEIMQIEKSYIICKILEMVSETTESNVNIDLFQGLPKSDKMEYIIQKCVEIGVSRIVPVITERAVVKIEKGAKEDKKIERWLKISESAAKQSGRGIIPIVERPVKLSEAIKEAALLENAVIPYENEEKTGLKEFIKSAKKGSIGIFIGPEGGFDSSEIEMAVKSGIIPVTLGKRILRTETAGLVTAAIILYELGWKEKSK